MSGGCYAERRAALRWPLVMWGLGLPLALVAVFVLLGILVNPDWFIAAVFTPMFVPVMMGISLLCRNWPTGIRIDERGVTIGAVGSRRAAVRRPTVTYQNWGLFSCAWRDINDVQVVTDPARLREIKKSAEYWTLSNRWGKPRQMTCCMAGVLTAPFMNAALVIDVGYAEVASPELRSALFFANWIAAPKFAERLRATPSPVWVVPTRNPDVLRDFLRHNWVAGGLYQSTLRTRVPNGDGCCGGEARERIDVDYVRHFLREVSAFEAAAWSAVDSEAAPAVPSCPEWVVTDLVLHLGVVHRFVAYLISERMQEPPGSDDRSWLEMAEEWRDWLPPGRAPQRSPVPAALLGWFHAGAADLQERFRAADPGERVWTWSADHSVGFWQRMQAIEAAVHRWDAENAVGAAEPIDAALAADAIGQTFEVMAPFRRAVAKAPPGRGERFLFRRTDGPETWVVQFDGDAVLPGMPDGHYGIQISGTASDLALFLWQRAVTDKLDVQGDTSLLSRYFTLVPPL